MDESESESQLESESESSSSFEDELYLNWNSRGLNGNDVLTDLLAIPESERREKIEVDLYNNPIIKLPDEVFGLLPDIQGMELMETELKTLPDSISRLTKLKTLDLDDNKLTSLPSSISLLTALEGLYLLNNKLTSLPSSILMCTALDSLVLTNNPSLPKRFQKYIYNDQRKTQSLLSDISLHFKRHENCRISLITLMAIHKFHRWKMGTLSELNFETN